MNIEKALQERSQQACELCKATENLNVYTLQPSKKIDLTDSIYACKTCTSQIEDSRRIEFHLWLSLRFWGFFII